MEIDLTKLTPDIRHLDDVRGVLYNRDFAKSSPNFELYYMYRKIEEKNGLKYNITVTTPKMLGQEFMKTKGHVHIGNFKEIYIVLEGEALYLMQKGDENNIEDVYAVTAKKGQAVIIPEGYGHVTINPSNVDLKTGDWTSIKCKSDYSLFEKLHGACYYYILQSGPEQASWIKNTNYKSVPKLRFEKPLNEVPQNLDFLK